MFAQELTCGTEIRLKSINTNTSLRLKVNLYPTLNITINTIALIDSGAAGYAFLNESQVAATGLTPRRLPRPRPLILADGKLGGVLSEYLVLPIRMGSHSEMGFFYIARLRDEDPVILGLP